MIDARNVYRKVTRKIYDFSPEQQQNLQAIVWLYRGETEKYLQLFSQYLGQVADEAQSCFEIQDGPGKVLRPLPGYVAALDALRKTIAAVVESQPKSSASSEAANELAKELAQFNKDIEQFRKSAHQSKEHWEAASDKNAALVKLTQSFEPMSETSRDLIKQADLIYKMVVRLTDICEQECKAKDGNCWSARDVARARNAADDARADAVEQLKQVRYFWKQAHWLTERFPDAELRDVHGLVKLVTRKEIEANDWSLTPGRYVGVSPEEVEEEFDFEELLREIHVEIDDLNVESVKLAKKIKRNFEELGA